ncbi:hypothetical protein N0V88_004358 [Collariella sp. IMI 366227]|nr:hypothetical protein N0V88_004358 [Collariella sp. IMI 366227]
MAPSSPTPAGPGSHYTTLGRRTSARQALRRPQYPSQSNSNLPSAAPAPSKYAALDDSSSDEERLRPMKLSALTKALLGGDYGSSSSSTAAPTSSTRRPRPLCAIKNTITTAQPPIITSEC